MNWLQFVIAMSASGGAIRIEEGCLASLAMAGLHHSSLVIHHSSFIFHLPSSIFHLS